VDPLGFDQKTCLFESSQKSAHSDSVGNIGELFSDHSAHFLNLGFRGGDLKSPSIKSEIYD